MNRLACVDVPALPLQILLRHNPEWREKPAAVVTGDKVPARVHWANRQAITCGVRPGMRQAAAVACCPALRIGHVRASEVEREASRLGERLHRWSPQVESASTLSPFLSGPGAAGVFWLRASGLAGLFGPLPDWAEALREDLAKIGFHASVAVGFTRFGAFAAARAVFGRQIFESPAAREKSSRSGAVGPFRPARQDPRRIGKARHPLPPGSSAPFREGGRKPFRRRGPGTAPTRFRRSRSACLPRLPARSSPRTPRRFRACRNRRRSSPLPRQASARPDSRRPRQTGARPRRTGVRGAPRRRQTDLRLGTPALPSEDGVLLLSLLRLRLRAEEETARPEEGMEEEPEENPSRNPGRRPERRVAALVLRARGEPRPTEQKALFGKPATDRKAASGALARIQAEFGEDALVRLEIRDAHLPRGRYPLPADLPAKGCRGRRSPARFPEHRSQNRSQQGSFPEETALVRRIYDQPLVLPHKHHSAEPGDWLLRETEPGGVQAVAGPYRICGGWWRFLSGRPISRDYFFVRLKRGEGLLGLFRPGTTVVVPRRPRRISRPTDG